MSMLETLRGINTLSCELIINVSTTIHNCHLIKKYFVKIELNQIKQPILKSNMKLLRGIYIYIYIYMVFWVNIAKWEVNLRYRYCLKLFGILRREIEF